MSNHTVATTGNGAAASVPANNGGTLLKGGAASSTSTFTTIALSTLPNLQGSAIGSKVVSHTGNGSAETDRIGVSGAVPGGFASQTVLGYTASSTEWVVMGGNVTRTLAGTAYTGLIGGATDINGANPLRGSTMQSSGTRLLGTVAIDTYAVPATGISSYRTKSGNTGVASDFVRPSGAGDEASADVAANSTRAVPGKLTYIMGGTPTTDNYSPQDAV